MAMLTSQDLRALPQYEPLDPRAFGFTKIAYSANETMDQLSIGRTSLHYLVKRGELRPARLGKKTLFLAADLAMFLIKRREAA